MTALEIAAQIRRKEKTISQVIEEHISKIQSVNCDINAVVETCYDKARSEAQAKDQIIGKMGEDEIKNLPPLFGVPFTCKEMIANEGMRSTMGSTHHRTRVMSKNATVVERVTAAGAILLGTSNVPEVGFWFECDNVVYGESKNPYDLRRTCGGSSGGEGAIVGAGASAFGIGSDIGGSIRIPAAFCGVFGHKSSDRLIPMTGHYPVYPDVTSEIVGARYPFTVVGPLARSAKDLEVLFRLMIGPDDYDSNIKKDFQLQRLPTAADDLRVYYISSPIMHGISETDEDLSRTVQNAARYLKEMGASVEPADTKTFLRAIDFWTARIWTLEAKSFSELLANDNSISYHKEIVRLALGKRLYTLPSLLMGFMDKFTADRSELERNLQDLKNLKSFLTQKLGKNGVLLMPTHPRKAPLLRSTYTRPFDFACTGVINALGFPATAIPMGLNSEGLPLSLQVIAAEDQDHLCLAVAQMLELGFGGYQPPMKKSES